MASTNAELRRLMQLKKASSAKRGVNHPLAKYNNLDQLVCVICTKVIKDDSLWNPHLQSKKHKENVMLIKNKTNTTSASSTQKPAKCSNKNSKTFETPKPPAAATSKSTTKQLPSDFFDQSWDGPGTSSSATQSSSSSSDPSSSSQPKSILKNSTSMNGNSKKPKSILKNSSTPTQSLLNQPSSTSNSLKASSSSDMETDTPTTSRKRKADDSNLPADFFDEGVKKDVLDTSDPATETKPEETNSEVAVSTKGGDGDASGSALPEGFFDDPKKDAAARNIEYVDPKEKEWQMFQKAIQEETKVSEAMQEDDDEESEMHKDLTELNKMKKCLSRVETLKLLMREEKEKKLEMAAVKDDSDDDSGDSDGDIDKLFDWRAKMA